MKTTKYIIGVALATMLIACSSDYENYVPEVEIPEEPTETIYFTEDELLVLMQMRNPDNRICIDEATEIALDALDFFDGEINTRSGQARSIADVTALRGEPATRLTTRSADGSDVKVQMPDTVAFVFNFADDAGFTIVAADTRITSPILAFVEDGNLDLSEELDHSGLEVFFAGMEEYIEQSIIEAEQLRESLLEDILAKMDKIGVRDTIFHDDVNTRFVFIPDPGNYVEVGRTVRVTETPGAWSTVARVVPLSTVEWGQGFPFNDRLRRCPGSEDGGAPAGCVAVAVAMLMAYWEHPRHMDGIVLDWRNVLHRYTGRSRFNSHENIRGTALPPRPRSSAQFTSSTQWVFKHSVSHLMQHIGWGVGMTHTCGNFGSYVRTNRMYRVIDFLHSMGYTGGHRENFNTQVVINSLNNHSPVLAQGSRSRVLWLEYRGHAWVIDGHLRRSREVLVTVTTFIYMEPVQRPGEPPRRGHTVVTTATHMRHELSPHYLHNNWGWDGRYNGFFVAGSFHVGDMRHGSYTRAAMADRNYRYGNVIFPNIRPR